MNEVFAEAAYVDFSGSRVLTAASQNLLMIPFQKKLLVGVEISGHYSAFNLLDRPCSSDLSHMDCRAQCRARYTARHCHCWPVSWSDLPGRYPTLSLCSQVSVEAFLKFSEPFNDYKIPHISHDQCINITTIFDLNPDCVSRCLPSCEDKIFGFKVQDAQNPQLNHVNETFVRLFQ